MKYMVFTILALSGALFAGSSDPASPQDWERYRLALKNLSDNNFITQTDYDKFVDDPEMQGFFKVYFDQISKDKFNMDKPKEDFEVFSAYYEQKQCSVAPANPSSSSASSNSESFLSSVGSAITFPFRWLFGKTGNSQDQNLASECEKIRVQKGILNILSFLKVGRYIRDDRAKLAAQQSAPSTPPATQASESAAMPASRLSSTASAGPARTANTNASLEMTEYTFTGGNSVTWKDSNGNYHSGYVEQAQTILYRKYKKYDSGIVIWEDADGKKNVYVPEGSRHQSYIDEANKDFDGPSAAP